MAVTVALYAVLPPARTLCDAGEAVSTKSLTTALNDRLFVHTPSVTDIVINDEPVCPAAGVTVIVRFVPRPANDQIAVRNQRLDWMDVAITCNDAPAVCQDCRR